MEERRDGGREGRWEGGKQGGKGERREGRSDGEWEGRRAVGKGRPKRPYGNIFAALLQFYCSVVAVSLRCYFAVISVFSVSARSKRA